MRGEGDEWWRSFVIVVCSGDIVASMFAWVHLWVLVFASVCVRGRVHMYVRVYEDSGNEMKLVPERRVCAAKTGTEISREKELEGRKV